VHGFSDSGDTAWILAVKDAYLDNASGLKNKKPIMI
jgi:hypothetical protein